MSVKLSFHAEKHVHALPRKPRAVKAHSRVAVFSPSSPAGEERTARGIEELRRLGFFVEPSRLQQNDGYFASSAEARLDEFQALLEKNDIAALFALRGGYGSNYLLDSLKTRDLGSPKAIIGFSDLTTLQIYLWQQCGWVTFYGPMIVGGLDAGAGQPNGYNPDSLQNAITNAGAAWTLPLKGEALSHGRTEGRLLGGTMTLVEATLGTPWELNTEDSILLLEDRAMKPYQVDRALMHLKQAGKFKNVRGLILGEFPECDPPVAGSPTVRDVCARILAPLGIPIVFGAAVGHTPRPMLTIPLGVRAQLRSEGEGVLNILEPTVTP